jgi:DNA-directed RNA polymerase subunit E'/Rpb7
MQHTAIFEEQVPLTPKDMRADIESIDEVLLEKLAAKLEGRCSRHGFVLAGTLKILSRSMGSLERGRFTGNILFLVQAEAMVLNPPDGTVLEGEVIRKNKMGMYVSYQDAIRIILPRDLYIGDEAYDAVQIGERIQVEVKKSRFQVNDPYILSVGYFRGLATGAASGAVPAPVTAVPAMSGAVPAMSGAVPEMSGAAPEEEEEEEVAETVPEEEGEEEVE